MANSSFVNDQAAAGAFEKITVSTVAIGPTAALLLSTTKARAARALISVETNSIRIRFDGSDPDANTGHLLTAGAYFTVDGTKNVGRIKMIRASADATVQLTLFYKRPQ